MQYLASILRAKWYVNLKLGINDSERKPSYFLIGDVNYPERLLLVLKIALVLGGVELVTFVVLILNTLKVATHAYNLC